MHLIDVILLSYFVVAIALALFSAWDDTSPDRALYKNTMSVGIGMLWGPLLFGVIAYIVLSWLWRKTTPRPPAPEDWCIEFP